MKVSQLERAIKTLIAEEIHELEKRLQERVLVAVDKDLTFTEACEYLGMSDYTLRKLVHAKAIPHRTYGIPGSKSPRYIFSQSGLDRWKREQEESNWIRNNNFQERDLRML